MGPKYIAQNTVLVYFCLVDFHFCHSIKIYIKYQFTRQRGSGKPIKFM